MVTSRSACFWVSRMPPALARRRSGDQPTTSPSLLACDNGASRFSAAPATFGRDAGHRVPVYPIGAANASLRFALFLAYPSFPVVTEILATPDVVKRGPWTRSMV